MDKCVITISQPLRKHSNKGKIVVLRTISKNNLPYYKKAMQNCRNHYNLQQVRMQQGINNNHWKNIKRMIIKTHLKEYKMIQLMMSSEVQSKKCQQNLRIISESEKLILTNNSKKQPWKNLKNYSLLKLTEKNSSKPIR